MTLTKRRKSHSIYAEQKPLTKG
uniref:Uncharacterized protein n=1 Tax=Rhizophora mucronata TaxID=61149 RepID=A0A2P2QKB5_RHIMU